MLQQAKELQVSAVNQLLEKTRTLKEITFRAPTGTGKTYMMADMMDQLLENDPNLVFLVSTLSKGELAEQNYDAFVEYQEHGRFPHLKPYLINTEAAKEERINIPETYNVYVLPRDLYKKNGKLMQGPMDAFLRNITTGDITTSVGKGKHIYLIKDECHQATNNLDSISSKYFDKVYNFSATPKLGRGQVPDVQIGDRDAVDAKLIKTVVWGDDEESLDVALKKYCDEIKPQYEEKLGMVPCIIIQISNKDMADEEWNKIIQPALDKYHIQWMYIVDKDKDCKTNHRDFVDKPVPLWKKYAKKDSSTVEAIVFKLAISEGWDIRRACMLYQIRSTKSKQLDEQVLGRIRRNPKLLTFEDYDAEAQSLAATAWAWGMQPPTNTKPVRVKLTSPTVKGEIKVQTTILADLSPKTGFDVAGIISSAKRKPTSPSIFDLYRNYEKANDDIKGVGKEYVKSVQDWLSFTTNLSEITKEYNEKICDYDKSMQLATDEAGKPIFATMPNESVYDDSEEYVIISDNIWKRKDGKDDFAFDSEAEKEFADLLLRLSTDAIKNDPGIISDVYLWGKNYLFGSAIRYEYYLNGTHFSYPDFILKDNHDRIHIFEVKSVNEGAMGAGFDSSGYKDKILELKKCYLHASKLTKHIFYLPIKEDRSWKITRLMNGVESALTKEQLKDFLMKAPF